MNFPVANSPCVQSEYGSPARPFMNKSSTWTLKI
jgi:hypothetical protein